jgi:hypothetical protein
MGAAVVRRDDLNVLAPPTAVRVFVLDADVREVDLIIEVGQVVFMSSSNLRSRAWVSGHSLTKVC